MRGKNTEFPYGHKYSTLQRKLKGYGFNPFAVYDAKYI